MIKNKWLMFIASLISISLFPHVLIAQVYYFYDNNGNRISSSVHHSAERRRDSNKISIYPNPTNGQVNVFIANIGTCEYANIYITDGFGSVVSVQKTTSQTTIISLASYPQGIYYLRAIMCNDQYSCKIVKVNPGSGTPAAKSTSRSAPTEKY